MKHSLYLSIHHIWPTEIVRHPGAGWCNPPAQPAHEADCGRRRARSGSLGCLEIIGRSPDHQLRSRRLQFTNGATCGAVCTTHTLIWGSTVAGSQRALARGHVWAAADVGLAHGGGWTPPRSHSIGLCIRGQDHLGGCGHPPPSPSPPTHPPTTHRPRLEPLLLRRGLAHERVALLRHRRGVASAMFSRPPGWGAHERGGPATGASFLAHRGPTSTDTRDEPAADPPDSAQSLPR